MLRRRTSAQRGLVNFPVHLRNTGEGGTFVRLYVREKDDHDWMMCCGGRQTFCLDESYIGDDSNGSFEDPVLSKETDSLEERDEKYNSFFRRHFPFYGETKKFRPKIRPKHVSEFDSFPCLAVMTIGSTGWTGTREDESDWVCTYEDLTDEGKVFYDSVRNLYGENCELFLLTFIDT